METADEEFLAATLDAMDRAKVAGKPFFIWHNPTRMHIWTHLQKKYQDMVAEKGLYGAGMTEVDDNVGVLLKKLDDLGITNNTIVIFTTDNGAETFSWPDGGTTPFRSEKNTNWEGGFRVPCLVRWPGLIKPGTLINDIVAHEDWVPTLLAAAGDPDVKEKLTKGFQAGGKAFKVHLDGYNQTDLLSGKGSGARKEFFYFSDDGDLTGLRYNKWKAVFLEQRAHGLEVWRDPPVPLRVPKIFDVHADPFERADIEFGCLRSVVHRSGFLAGAGSGGGGSVPGDLPGVPAAPKTRFVQCRSGTCGHAEGICRRRLATGASSRVCSPLRWSAIGSKP